MAYRTEWDIKKEKKKEAAVKHPRMRAGTEDMLRRDYQIYYEKCNWTGTANAFNEKISSDYSMSVQGVKNIVSRMKRIIQLKSEIFIYEDISYRSLAAVYQNIYADYTSMKNNGPALTDVECAERLAVQYGFTRNNILRIVQIMQSETAETYLSKNRKLTKTETLNRDKSLFVDFLRWAGDRKTFCEFAAQKYNISTNYAHAIIRYCLYADADRYKLL